MVVTIISVAIKTKIIAVSIKAGKTLRLRIKTKRAAISKKVINQTAIATEIVVEDVAVVAAVRTEPITKISHRTTTISRTTAIATKALAVITKALAVITKALAVKAMATKATVIKIAAATVEATKAPTITGEAAHQNKRANLKPMVIRHRVLNSL